MKMEMKMECSFSRHQKKEITLRHLLKSFQRSLRRRRGVDSGVEKVQRAESGGGLLSRVFEEEGAERMGFHYAATFGAG
jgi:hypothetical protein